MWTIEEENLKVRGVRKGEKTEEKRDVSVNEKMEWKETDVSEESKINERTQER